jgi:hypothetical protein
MALVAALWACEPSKGDARGYEATPSSPDAELAPLAQPREPSPEPADDEEALALGHLLSMTSERLASEINGMGMQERFAFARALVTRTAIIAPPGFDLRFKVDGTVEATSFDDPDGHGSAVAHWRVDERGFWLWRETEGIFPDYEACLFDSIEASLAMGEPDSLVLTLRSSLDPELVQELWHTEGIAN